MTIRKLIFGLFSCLVWATVLHAGTLREEFDQTFDLVRGGTVILDNTNGSVTVTAWDRDEVHVYAEKIIRGGNRREAEEAMQRVKIEITHNDGVLKIRTDAPKFGSRFWESLFGDDVSAAVNYRIEVPNGLKMDVSTVNGTVEIRGVAGELRASSTNGRIAVTESKGSVDAKTTNGAIDVELLEVVDNPEMSFKTTNGSIAVRLPSNLSAQINASTTNGSIRTDFPITLSGELSKKRLRGTINSGGGRIDLHTTNGGIQIREL
jgi:hypothetical protein